MLRFQLIFRLTSSVDDNYLHIHTLKGIVQASTVSSPPVLHANAAAPAAAAWLVMKERS